ncbi:MAG: ubiquinol-cytochrome C chaperone family protein [Pacificimonas sp.]
MFFKRSKPDPESAVALGHYQAIVARARKPDWYVAGQVPDTVDGRFDMVALMLSLYTFRLEAIDTPAARRMIARVDEHFVEDMDASLRQIGIGDMVIGKHVGKTMSALGGRLGAYREAGLEDDDAMKTALQRNLYRGVETPPLDWALARVREEQSRLAALADAELLA